MLCSVTDGDLPLTLKWYRHDQLLMPEGGNSAGGISITEIGSYESVLRIDNLRPEHNANFTCVAENFAGSAAHSQILRVKGRLNLMNNTTKPLHEKLCHNSVLDRKKLILKQIKKSTFRYLVTKFYKNGFRINEEY